MMNERIQELADQAEDYATAEYEKWTPTPDFSGIPHIRKIFNEKFAQLIVQECLELCNKEHAGSIHTHAGAWNTAIKRCTESIETHFGVEE
jgi:hypothetical protein